MRAAIYTRVSSVAQRDRDTIAAQLRDLPAFVDRQGWTLAREPYVDDGRTAKAGHLRARVGLTSLLEDAAAGLFDVVVVADVDRLTRAADMAERGFIFGALQRAGVKIASANSGQVSDPSTGEGDLLISLGGYFAAEWGRKHRSRIMAGKASAIAKGKKPAGPTPYGLTYDRATGAWGIDETAALVIREIYERVALGHSCETIAHDFDTRGVPRPRGGKWQRERVWQIVTSPTCVGKWTADKARGIVLDVPPIVDDVTAARARATLEAWGKRGMARSKHVYLLERLAQCICGEPISIQSATLNRTISANSVARYICRHRRRPPWQGERCRAPTARVSDIDERVWSVVAREIQDPALVEWVIRDRRSAADGRDWLADAAGYRHHLERLERVETGWLTRYQRGAISDGALDTALAGLRRERDAVRDHLATAETARRSIADAQAAADTAERVLADLSEATRVATAEERRDILRVLVRPRSAIIDGDRVTMTLHAPTAPGAVASDGLARAAGWNAAAVTSVRIRVVA